MHFLTFIAKERPPGDSYSFFTILEAKEWAGVTIRHTNWDRLPRSSITNLDRIATFWHKYEIRLPCSGITNLDRIATFRHANCLCLGSMREPLNWVP
uniref:Uncharacterized protein n=1 Tax=Solanum tuberosum TaxID=4113 RepID=M1D3Q9_SOLTU